MAELFKQRYLGADIAPFTVSRNVERLYGIVNDNTNVAYLYARASVLPVSDAYIEKVQADNLKKLGRVIRNDTSIQKYLGTLATLIGTYDGPSSDELKALFETLVSRITTSREDTELYRKANQAALVLYLVKRREAQEEKDKKLEAKKAAGRFRFYMSAE